jgi:hypothetical protein
MDARLADGIRQYFLIERLSKPVLRCVPARQPSACRRIQRT